MGSKLFRALDGRWLIESTHLVQVPVVNNVGGFLDLLRTPDFSHWSKPAVNTAAFTLAAVASLETLLNLEAVDKLDPRQRTSQSSRELIAQGWERRLWADRGGLPITSVVVRSSVNINAGVQTKRRPWFTWYCC